MRIAKGKSYLEEVRLEIWRHVESMRKGEMCINLLLLHSHHVECVAHSIKAEHLGKAFKASALLRTHFSTTLRAIVHVVSIKGVLDTQLVQRFLRGQMQNLAKRTLWRCYYSLFYNKTNSESSLLQLRRSVLTMY